MTFIRMKNCPVTFPPAWFGHAGANDNAAAMDAGPCHGLRMFCGAVGNTDPMIAELAFLLSSHDAAQAASDAAAAGFKAIQRRPQEKGNAVAAVTVGAVAGLISALDGLLDDVKASGDPRHAAFIQHLLERMQARHKPGLHDKAVSLF